LYEGQFVDGKIHSEKAVIFHYNGTVKYTGGYFQGRREGKGKLFHTSGNLRYCGYFKAGKIHDEDAVLLFSNGKIEYQGGINMGKKEGEGFNYNNDGSLKKSGIFKEGKLVNEYEHKENKIVCSSKKIPIAQPQK